MSNADLILWLGARGHGVFAPAIARAGVDLATLQTMNAWDLEKIGIPRSTHRTHLVADLKVDLSLSLSLSLPLSFPAIAAVGRVGVRSHL